jgi:hypothetical protein
VAVPTSVIPYASVIANPAAAANSLSSSVEALSDAERHTRSEAKWSGCRSWSRTSAISAAGSMESTVGWCSRNSASSS